MKTLLIALGLTALPILAQSQTILQNADFEQSDPAHPGKAAHWDLTDGLGVQWANAPALPGAPAHGKAIRMDTSQSETTMVASYAKAGLTQWIFPKATDEPVAVTYGLSLYSEAVPVVAGKTYRVTFDYYSEKGTAGKLWFRGYDAQKKRVYEGNVDCSSTGTWKTFTGIFHPTKYRPNVVEFKIMLFSYFPPGVSWWDNVKVEAVDEAE